jgi:DNA-binding CsgD family transcriptional regulator
VVFTQRRAVVESRRRLIREVFSAHHDRLRSLVDEVVCAHERRAARDTSTDLTRPGQLPHRWSSLDLVASAPALEWLATAAQTSPGTRVLCDVRVLRRTRAFGSLRILLDRGVAIRVSHTPLTPVAVVDGTRVLLWSADGWASPAAIDEPAVAAAFASVYATLWRSAVDFDCPVWADRLTPAQQRVLQLLRLGLSDDEVSRAVGTGRQAVRLHVGSILSRLQASTRFSAGVAAARRETGEPDGEVFDAGTT